MPRFSIEFRVGLLTIAVLALVVLGILRTDDKPGDVGEVWHVTGTFPSVEGVYVSTPVRTAGVTIGAVSGVQLKGSIAVVTLELLGNVQLPSDSVATLKADGLLGDKSVKIVPGVATTFLKNGDEIRVGDPPPDMEAITRQVGAIAEDVKAITSGVRSVTDDEATRLALAQTIQNVLALSEELRAIAAQNGDDLAIIADNLREVSETLNAVVTATGADVAKEMEAILLATQALDATLRNLQAITEKINAGEGTVGKLLNDSDTIDSVNATLDEVNGIVSDVSRLRTEVFYRGNYFFGSTPTLGEMEGRDNPTAGGTRNALGVKLQPSEDHWYLLEFVGHPQGSISYEDHYLPDMGTQYREIVVKPGYRFTFQFAKRFYDLAFRFGVKESGGGFGLDYHLFDDRMLVSADVFDFTYGSYPLLNGTPNVQLNLRASPVRHIYLEAGLDNIAMGARYGYVTAYAGGGFTFDDKDMKYVMALVPTP